MEAPDKAEVSFKSNADLLAKSPDFSRIGRNSWTYEDSLTVVSLPKEAASLALEIISLADACCFRVSLGLKLCCSLFVVGCFSTVAGSWGGTSVLNGVC
jgi:hypothetical protein